MVLSKANEYLLQAVIGLLFESSLSSLVGPCVFRAIISHQRALSTICDVLSQTNCTQLLTLFSDVQKTVSNWWIYFFWIDGIIIFCPFGASLCHLTSSAPVASKVPLAISLVIFLSDPDLYCVLTCQISYQFSPHYIVPKYLPGSETVLSTS